MSEPNTSPSDPATTSIANLRIPLADLATPADPHQGEREGDTDTESDSESESESEDTRWECVAELPHPDAVPDDADLDGGHAVQSIQSLYSTPSQRPATVYHYDGTNIRLHLHPAGATPLDASDLDDAPDIKADADADADPDSEGWQLTVDARDSHLAESGVSTIVEDTETVRQLATNTAVTIHALYQALSVQGADLTAALNTCSTGARDSDDGQSQDDDATETGSGPEEEENGEV